MDKEKIKKVIKRHLRDFVLIDRDASYDIKIPDAITISRDSFLDRLMEEIDEVLEEDTPEPFCEPKEVKR